MNFSFDESGGISSQALSEQNSNLLWFFTFCSKLINFDFFFINLLVPKISRIRPQTKIKKIQRCQ